MHYLHVALIPSSQGFQAAGELRTSAGRSLPAFLGHLLTPQASWASLVAQTVKNLPAIPETQVRSQGQEDPLEKGTATHSSLLAWRIPWTEEPGGLQSTGSLSRTHLSD